MKTFYLALGCGILAGLIDTLPMRKGPAPITSIFAIFVQWVLTSFVIAFISWEIHPIAKGAIIGFAGMIPFAIQLWIRNKKAILPTLIMAVVLGVSISWIIHFSI